MYRVSFVFLAGLCGLAFGQSTCETNRLTAVKNGKQVPQGVNLGSWLLLEGWMVKNIWTDNGCDLDTIKGQYMLENKCLGSKAKSVMDKHWSTWITEDDFKEMSKRGINLVRIPVGWWHIYDPQGGAANASLNWHIDPKTYVVGGLAYLDKAFEWGKKHGIAILVDLHAAPGSQNGNDHSSPPKPGVIDWDKYEANIGQSVDSMELYAERYGSKDALWGFQFLNEPAVDIPKMQDYYKKAYDAVRKHSKNSYIVINPLFTYFEYGTESHWTSFMNPADGYTKVAMDLHYYSCTNGAGDSTDADFNINFIKVNRTNMIKEYKAKNPKLQIVGEWSACQHGSSSRTPEFFRAEVDVFSTTTAGFTFWSWKVPNSTPWSLQDVFKAGWLDNFDQPC